MNVKNLLNKFAVILTISIALSGCLFYKEPIQITTIAVPKPKLQIENTPPLKLLSVQWVVVTPENADIVFTDMDKKKEDLALFSLTDSGYKNLSLNIAEIRKYIIQQNEILSAYRKYYEED